MEYTDSNPLKLIELFAGIGSQTQALKNIGVPHEVVAISEIDKYAIQSYEAIHGKVKNMGDIRAIKELPKADMWTYSFPCQDISVAGKGAGIKEGTRSGLLFEVERLLKVAAENGTLPKYLLLENVKNLVSKKFRADFDSWLFCLSELGYANYWKVLNAKDYGIPQNRERVFCVSIRGPHMPFIFPEKQELKLRLRDMIDRVVDEKYYLKESTIRSILASKFNARRDSIRQPEGIACCLKARDFHEPQCVQVGELTGEKWDKMHDISRRVYDTEGLSPTVHCQGGGNTELKIAENFVLGGLQEHQTPRTDGISPSLTEAMGKGGGQTPIIIDTNQATAERFFKQAVETVLKNECEAGDTVDAFNKKVNRSGICPTITTRPEGFKTAILTIVEDNSDESVVVAGQFQPVDRDYKSKGEKREERFECRADDISNAVLTGDRKNCICIAALRGRNPDNPSDRTAGLPTEQRLEVNEKGLCNTLTTVQKDNLVMEPSDYVARRYGEFIEDKGYIPEMFVVYNKSEIKDIAPTLTGQCASASGSSAVLKMETEEVSLLAPNNWNHKAGDGQATRERKETDICPALQATAGQSQQSFLKIKVATKKGYEEAKEGDYVNITYPGSNTKRGRVGDGIAHTLTCGDGNAVVTQNVRIRKLTPRECLRLMGWKDEQIDRIASAKISGTQQYRQAGNGIVVQVLEEIFKALFLS